jgi:hypothetical protein
MKDAHVVPSSSLLFNEQMRTTGQEFMIVDENLWGITNNNNFLFSAPSRSLLRIHLREKSIGRAERIKSSRDSADV